MILNTFIGLGIVSATVVLHAGGTAWWLQRLRNRPRAAHRARHSTILVVLVQTALVLITLHVAEVFLWALSFRLLPGTGLESLEQAMYFSFTTFTTLGYGDITLEGRWRLLTGIESLNGVILIGWSTALSFAVIQRVWEGLERRREER